jgi:uncharacterized membrane protein
LETAFISPPPLLPCFRGYINRQPTFAALGLGSPEMLEPKGTGRHRALGWVWVMLMIAVAASSPFIHTIRTWGVWSPIYLLSLFTLPTIPLAVVYARRVVFALVNAGLFKPWPGQNITR